MEAVLLNSFPVTPTGMVLGRGSNVISLPTHPPTSPTYRWLRVVLPSRVWCSTPACSAVQRRTFHRDRPAYNYPTGRSPRRSTVGSGTVALRRHWDTVRRTRWAAPARAGSSSGTLLARILHKRDRGR